MSSTCLADLTSFIISNSGSNDAELKPKCVVVFFSLREKALGASFVPVPGLRHCKQCTDSS
eukprot:1480336-Lingulodinium_polyedra.AAC.1